jgi:hypothetical protein
MTKIMSAQAATVAGAVARDSAGLGEFVGYAAACRRSKGDEVLAEVGRHGLAHDAEFDNAYLLHGIF